MSEMNPICSVCGAHLGTGMAFCPYCGSAVTREEDWEKTVYDCDRYGYPKTVADIDLEQPVLPEDDPVIEATYRPETVPAWQNEPSPFQRAEDYVPPVSNVQPQPVEKATAKKHSAPVMQETSESMTLKQFYAQFASKKTKNVTTALTVICFVIAFASFGGTVGGGSVTGILHLPVFAVLGFLLLKVKQWYIPLVVMIWTVAGGLLLGLVGGVAIMAANVVLGILSMRGLRQIDHAFAAYRNSGVFPESLI